jgi:hypothetical protein
MESAKSGVVSAEACGASSGLGVLLPPNKHILVASKTNVCSLMNTSAIRFGKGNAALRGQELSIMFKRVQQIRSYSFNLPLRKYL